MIRARAGAALVVVLIAVLAGCTTGKDRDMTNGESTGGSRSDAPLSAEELRARPALEDVTATYEVMLTEMRTALSRQFSGDWSVSDPPGGGPATGATDGVAADFATTSLWQLDSSVSGSAEDKSAALGAITPIAERYGFVTPVVFLDRDGDLEAVADDAYGAKLRFSSVVATVLGVTTGAHLRRAELAAGGAAS